MNLHPKLRSQTESSFLYRFASVQVAMMTTDFSVSSTTQKNPPKHDATISDLDMQEFSTSLILRP